MQKVAKLVWQLVEAEPVLLRGVVRGILDNISTLSVPLGVFGHHDGIPLHTASVPPIPTSRATYRVVEDLEITGRFQDALALGHVRPKHVVVHFVALVPAARPKKHRVREVQRQQHRRWCHRSD
jgi:hypothetical protein